MRYKKKKLVRISNKVIAKQPITPEEMDHLLSFMRNVKDPVWINLVKSLALPLSLLLGFLFTVYPDYFAGFTTKLPKWTNLSPQFLAGADYLWDFIGEPVGKANLLYHLPNIVLYSFGVVGVKKLFDALDRKSWMEKVLLAQSALQEKITKGQLNLRMKKGHSLLFAGNGDFIAAQFTLDHNPAESVTISANKPSYATIWNHYDAGTLYEDLKQVVTRSNGENCGEYVFFPVKDDQIFLPGPKDYDLSPYKLDILIQDLRTIEKEQKWKPKRVIIIGDKFHKSFVQSEDQKGVIKKSGDTISLKTIIAKYKNITLIDPTDIVLKEVIKIAYGRKIVLRATREGLTAYKKSFYNRLKQLGYKKAKKQKGILTIGYDLFEDQTEQQTLSRKIDDYYPVVLSKGVHDALIRNGYHKEDFLYVPSLVLKALKKAASEQ
jgi:hypothetical protein